LPDDFTIKNARVLDIFAGTGSLGLEALSRGAKSVNFIDINQGHLDALGRFAAKIGASDCVEVFNLDANNLPYSDKNYNLVFMDPPYNSHYPQKLLLSLVANNWLEQGAVIVIEVASGQKVELGEHYALLKNKCYGNNQLLLLRYGKK
jgi:16S rRNA (guanine966-N2)-methyltransferase